MVELSEYCIEETAHGFDEGGWFSVNMGNHEGLKSQGFDSANLEVHTRSAIINAYDPGTYVNQIGVRVCAQKHFDGEGDIEVTYSRRYTRDAQGNWILEEQPQMYDSNSRPCAWNSGIHANSTISSETRDYYRSLVENAKFEAHCPAGSLQAQIFDELRKKQMSNHPFAVEKRQTESALNESYRERGELTRLGIE